MINVRAATMDDLDAITEIYNEAIRETTATFDTEPKSKAEQARWFNDHGDKYPILAAQYNDHLIGWSALSRWSDRCAYSDTAEISLYIQKDHQGKGFGKKLLHATINKGRTTGLHSLIARITEGNEISARLFRSAGFSEIGVMKEVGRKFGKLLDVYLMQLIYDQKP
jgi:phosphinothricin acetyltransferase